MLTCDVVQPTAKLAVRTVEHGIPPGDADCKSKCLEEEEDFKNAIDSPMKQRRAQRKELRSLHSYVARSGAVAVAASASMITRQVEQFAGAEVADSRSPSEGRIGNDFKAVPILVVVDSIVSHARSCLTGALARCGQSITKLAQVIGEPPHRPLAGGWTGAHAGRAAEEQETPLMLFWALNLCVFCCLASIIYFIAAFWAGGSGSDGVCCTSDAAPELEVAAVTMEDGTRPNMGPTRDLDSLLRVLAVMLLSLISGCGLGWRHPLQSALLCGM